MKNVKRDIHIAHGGTAGGVLRSAINPRPGTLLVSSDLMSYGPLDSFSNLDEWHALREPFYSSIYSELHDFRFEEDEYDILSNTDKLKDADKITLWIGSGLADQILLVWMVQLFKVVSADIEKLQVIQFDKEPANGSEVVSVAALNPAQLLKHPDPASLGGNEIEYIDRVWNALTASRPDDMMEILYDENQAPLNLLHRSLKFLLGRFPDYETGLTFWDKELLKYAFTKGPKAARIIGFTMGNTMDNLDWVGDMFLYHRLRRLGHDSLAERAVILTGNSSKMRDTEVHVTTFGEKILNGELNFVKVNGISEWIGGIRLQSKTNDLWYRKNDAIVESKT